MKNGQLIIGERYHSPLVKIIDFDILNNLILLQLILSHNNINYIFNK